MQRRILLILPGWLFAALLAAPTTTKADFQYTLNPTLSSGTTFVYDVNFNSAVDPSTGPTQRLDPYTDGIPPSNLVGPSSPGSFTFLPNNGSLGTLYDIPGFISATLTGASAGQFAISTQNLGYTSERINPNDNPALTNVTLYYRGPAQTVDTTFTGVLTVIVGSDFTARNSNGVYFGRTTKVATNGPVDVISDVIIPSAVPEPSSVVLLGLGGLAVVGTGLRRRFARA